MKPIARLALLLGAALSFGASAQRIEISSESLGTVVVTPPAIGGDTARTPTAALNRNGPRTGVDLGIQRRTDGTLYDALDPAQNPAAAPAAGVGSNAANSPTDVTSNTRNGAGASAAR